MKEDLGKVIRFHRKQANLSQVQLARLAGIGKTAVFDIEAGKKTVRYQTLIKVLSALNIELNWNSPFKQIFGAQQNIKHRQ